MPGKAPFPARSSSTRRSWRRSSAKRFTSASIAKRRPMAMCRAGWKKREKIMSRNKKLLTGGAGLAALAVAYGLVPQAGAQTPGVYNLEQATNGHSAYVASCAGCHRANLAGGGDAPALGGNG